MATTTAAALLLLALTHSAMSITVPAFFSNTADLKSNLTKVTWSHAVNSEAALKKVLSSNETMMIEADVSMGKTKEDKDKPNVPEYPVMAHDKNATIDLKLEDFIMQVVSANKTGMKLDFKSIEALQGGVEVILNVHKQKNISVPLWVNADILKGPNATANQIPVDAKGFFAAVQKLPNDTLLSIGWTTDVNKQLNSANSTFGQYNKAHIEEMIKELSSSNVKNAVTYPVRAVYVANDNKDSSVLKQLLDDTKDRNSTLTIWSGNDDVVDATKLSAVIKLIGLDKIYLDVPMALRQKLDLNSAFSARSSAALLLSSVLVAIAGFKVL